MKAVYGQTVLIVTEVKNHLMMSIKEHLEKAGYNGILFSSESEEYTGAINGIFISADWETLKQQPMLNSLKMRAISESIPVFAIGAKDGLKVLKITFSGRLVYMDFVRPIDIHVSEMVDRIDSAIKQYNQKKKILVIDDSGAMLRTIKEWLSDKYDVFTANSGAMAIKYLATNTPDLILLDYEMPIVDGKQVLEMFRTETDFANLPVMFLTSKGDPESIMNVRDLKPNGYLLKSMDSANIIKAIDDFFKKKDWEEVTGKK